MMADVIAATASHQIGLSRVGVNEKLRHKNIAKIAVDALEGGYHPSSRETDVVLKRLREIVATP